jgi:hypothetical protein
MTMTLRERRFEINGRTSRQSRCTKQEAPTPGLKIHALVATDRAHFSFNVTDAHLEELCFKTEDHRLVSIFSGVFDHLSKAAGIRAESAKA